MAHRAALRLYIREPGKAYIDNMLWLPKAGVRIPSVQHALEFFRVENGEAISQKLWEDAERHLIVPREFIAPKDYQSYGFPFVDLRPKHFPRTGIRSRVTLRDTIPDGRPSRQREAWEAFHAATSGVLNLGPGKGKTVLACHKIAEVGTPALVVVHNTYLMEQWKERIAQFLELPVGEKLGVIQGSEFDWKHPITIAMIHSLALRAQEGSIPDDFGQHFGQAHFDEIHHLSAPLFVATAPVCMGYRYGLSAVPMRLDGLEFVYQYHIGSTFFTDIEMELVPRIYFQATPVTIDLRDRQVRDTTGEVNISKLRSALGDNPEGNHFRHYCIKEAHDSGRKILVLSHSKKQLIELSERFPGSCLIIQETPQDERTELVRNSSIVFAIARLGVEGLDDANLDTLFFLTPFSSPHDLRQALGRIQRVAHNKNHPVAIVFDDVNIPPLNHLCNKLRKTLKSWQIPFQTLPSFKP